MTKTVDSHNQKNDNSTNKRVHSHDYGDHHEEKAYQEEYIQTPSLWGELIPPMYLPEDLQDSMRVIRKDYFDTMIELIKTKRKFQGFDDPKWINLLQAFSTDRVAEDENGMMFYRSPGPFAHVSIDFISKHFLRYEYYTEPDRIFKDMDEYERGNLRFNLELMARKIIIKKYNKVEPITGCPFYTSPYDGLLCAIPIRGKDVAPIWNKYGKYATEKFGTNDFIPMNKNGYFEPTAVVESVYHEEVGDADDDKPESDNPIRDTMMDVDRKVSEGIGSLKRGAGKVRQTARAISKPFKRVLNFIDTQIEKWRDSNENDIKEQLADPHQSNSLIKAFKSAVKYGAIYKAGLLLNTIFIFLAAAKHLDSRNNKFRIRNEMIGELKTELQVLEEKIKDADANKDRKAKYQMMRLKNELTKKLIRVGGTGDMKNMI